MDRLYSDHICPKCKGSNITENRWRDDIQGYKVTVEYLLKCQDCGYTYHWAYGNTEIIEPKEYSMDEVW